MSISDVTDRSKVPRRHSGAHSAAWPAGAVAGPQGVERGRDARRSPSASNPLASSRGGSLDKLGKSRQAPPNEAEEARQTMRRRAAAKWATWQLTERLGELETPSMEYGRAFGCCKAVEQNGGALTSFYCRCRWCVVCNRIRMAHRINTYSPVLAEWEDVQFVTLTTPNVRAGELRDELDRMQHQFTLCKRQIRRTRELDFKAVRATEVTFNAERADFNPHFHVAVEGEEQAVALVTEWLKRWPEASRSAQDVRPWDGEEESLRELMKYCTKLTGAAEDEEPPPAWALDVIFASLDGKHLVSPIGFKLPDDEADFEEMDEEAFEELEPNVRAYSRPGENVMWWWSGCDWVDRETGECLTEWAPSEAHREAVGANSGPDPPD